VVEKLNSAQQGSVHGGIAIQRADLGASRGSSSSLQEEIVRPPTRFSVFEIWYQNLIRQKAIGHFDSWGPESLVMVETGDTVEFKAVLTIASVQALGRVLLAK
jgi:hypothetical protein